MSRPVPFPLAYPGDVRPALASEPYVRRMARAAELVTNAKVLVLGVGDGRVVTALAQLGAQVVAADASEAALERLRSKLQLPLRAVSYDALPFAPGEFDAIFVDVMPVMSLEQAVRTLRPLLATNGRLCLGYPVRVSRHANPAAVRFWEQKLGAPMLLPREALQVMEQNGYEPHVIETLDDAALDEFYREVDQAWTAVSDGASLVREEIALHRSQQGRASTSFAVMVGRRKEPGERPPPSRNE